MYPDNLARALSSQLDAERAIHGLTMAAFESWLPQVKAAVLPTLTAAAELPPDPDQIPNTAGAWELALDEAVLYGIGLLYGYELLAVLDASGAVVEDIIDTDTGDERARERQDRQAPVDELPNSTLAKQARKIVASSLGVSTSDITAIDRRLANLPTVRSLQSEYLGQVRNRMVNTPEAVFRDITVQLDKAIAAGEGSDAQRQRVQQFLSPTTGDWTGRAMTVARTESAGAMSHATIEAATLRNEVLEEDLTQIWLCVSPDTLVGSPEAMYAARRRYKGPLVRITTASGRKLSLTPEHPVLTGRGWVVAGELDLTDHLFTILGAEPAGAPDVEDGPAQIGQLVDAAIDDPAVQVRTMRSSVDLDVDTVGDDVEVVRVHRELSVDLESAVPQHLRELFLVDADTLAESLVLGDSSAQNRLSRLGASAVLGRDRSVLGGLPIGVFPRGTEHAGSRLVADRHPLTQQDVSDVSASAPELFGDRGGRVASFVGGEDRAAVDVTATPGFDCELLGGSGLLDSVGVAGDREPHGLACSAHPDATILEPVLNGLPVDAERPGEFGDGLAGFVSADDVVHIELEPFDDHVYDLSTVAHWYSANGVIVHNCTLDSRTRKSHWAADGQRVPLGSTFRVGRAQIRYPGDPRGPAEEVMNCRCRVAVLAADEALPGESDRHTERGPGDSTVRNRAGTQQDEIDRRAEEGNIRAREDPAGLGRVASIHTEEQDMADEDTIEIDDTTDVDTPDTPDDAGEDTEGGVTFRTFTDSVIAVLGTPTDDRRILAADMDFRFRDFPLPVMWTKQSSEGHAAAYTVGVMETARIEDNQVLASGYLLNTDEADEAADQLAHGVTGPSVDLVDADWIYTNEAGEEITEEMWEDAYENGVELKIYETVTSAKLAGVTLVSTPAFGETILTLDPARVTKNVAVVASLVAAAARPVDTTYDASLFANPQLDGPTPVTYDAKTGRIYGHLACFGQCHVGITDQCVVAPRSKTDYAHFHTSPPVLTTDGRLPVGRLTVGTGHAGPRLGARPAAEHYDNTGTCFALVRVGEDEHGIWFSGIPHPTATDEQIRAGLSAPLSGDWRTIGGNLELVAALAVNTPGFPVLVAGASDENDRPRTLVASLGPRAESKRTSRVDPKLLAQEVVREMRAQDRRNEQARKLLASVDRRREARAIIEQVGV